MFVAFPSNKVYSLFSILYSLFSINMNYRSLTLLCLLAIAPLSEIGIKADATAQVSVRRGGSRSESSSRRDKKKDKDKDKDKKATTAQSSTAANAPTTAKPETTSDASPVRRTQPTRQATTAAPSVDGNSVRLQAFNEYQRRDESVKPWQHVVYRKLDLTIERNASLYYPTEPQDGLTSLFRVILDGLCSGSLRGYEYLDGREIFEPKYEAKVSDILDKFQIMYQQKPAVGQNGRPTYVVEEMDVPSNEVLAYYIKERWEFNQKTSTYGPRILALCPVLYRSGDFGGEDVPYPMFWVNYEDLRPLIRTQLIMSDGMNNAPRFTMEEFFTLQQYQGEIYKVQNVRGLSLAQQYPDADSLKLAQAKIEAQLRGFGDSIWVHEPTAAELAAQDSIRAAIRAEAKSRSKNKKGDTANASGKRNRRTKEPVDTDAIAAEQEAKADELETRIEQTGTAHSARRSARR